MRADTTKESKFFQQMQALFIIFRQRRVQRKAALAGKAGALVFLQIDHLGFHARKGEVNALDEMLQVFHRQRHGAGELPFVGEVAEDVARHRQRQGLFVFNEACRRGKLQIHRVVELSPRGELAHAVDDLAEAAQLRLRMLLRRQERRAGHELGIIRLRPGWLLPHRGQQVLNEAGVQSREAIPLGFTLQEFTPAVFLFEFAAQIRQRVRPALVVVVQELHEFGMVALQPAQERAVQNACVGRRQLGIRAGGEGEDEAC